MIHTSDPIARHYNQVQRRLGPLTRGIFSMLRRNGSLTALDAQRSPLGCNSSSFTKRVSELRDAGFTIETRRLRDDITGRIYTKYNLGPMKEGT